MWPGSAQQQIPTLYDSIGTVMEPGDWEGQAYSKGGIYANTRSTKAA